MAIAANTSKQLSQAGRQFLHNLEGVRLKPYKDTRGIWTVGRGHTTCAAALAKVGLELTNEQVESLFTYDLRPVEATINHHLPGINQNQFDALVCFVFNIGIGAFEASTLLRRAKAGDLAGAANEFARWVKQPELAGRRQLERDLFLRSPGS